MTTTGHGNQRGNSADRRRRREWMLNHFGNGRTANCWECGRKVNFHTMVVDRIKPGKHGGTYRRNNIRPQCSPCSNRQGYRLGVGNGSVRNLGNGNAAITRVIPRMEKSLMLQFIRRFIVAIGFVLAFVTVVISDNGLPAPVFILSILAGIALAVIKEVRAMNRS